MTSLRALLSRCSRGALVVSWLVLAALAGSAAAMTVLPLDLAALTGRAEHIFVGRVEHVEAGRDSNGLPAVWTTFAVEESVKGAAGGHLTVKELGTALDASGGRVVAHAGIPRHQPGEEVVLFLHAEGALGFTSPVGLGQGCFRIRDQGGRRVVENDVGNRNLGAAARARAGASEAPGTQPEPLPLESLLGRVRALAATP